MTEEMKQAIRSIVDNFTFRGSDIPFVLSLLDNLEKDDLTESDKEALKKIIHNTSFKGADIPFINAILSAI